MKLLLLIALGAFIAAPADARQASPFTPATVIEQALQERPKTRDFPVGRGPAGIVHDRPSIPIIIRFERDSAQIKAESHEQLAECAKALNGGLKSALVAVAGHASTEGSEGHNLLLSRRRAEAVRRFLANDHGVDAGRLRIEAYGESRPLIPDERTEADREQNRRVEFIRLGRAGS